MRSDGLDYIKEDKKNQGDISSSKNNIAWYSLYHFLLNPITYYILWHLKQYVVILNHDCNRLIGKIL